MLINFSVRFPHHHDRLFFASYSKYLDLNAGKWNSDFLNDNLVEIFALSEIKNFYF